MYIAGESYGGIYVPYLTFENILAKAEDRLPIKGIIIANGVTDWTIDTTPAMAAMLFWHNLIDLDMEMKLKENNCFPWKLSVYAGKEGPRNEVECDSLMDTIMDVIFLESILMIFTELVMIIMLQEKELENNFSTEKKGHTREDSLNQNILHGSLKRILSLRTSFLTVFQAKVFQITSTESTFINHFTLNMRKRTIKCGICALIESATQ